MHLQAMLRDVRDFKVFRALETNPDRPLARLRMRKSVTDLHARAEATGRIVGERQDRDDPPLPTA